MNEPQESRRPVAILVLVIIVGLIAVLGVAIVTAPTEVTSVVNLDLSAPGAELFLGDSKIPTDSLPLSLTGDEAFLLDVADLQEASARQALTSLGDILELEALSSFTHGAPPFPVKGQNYSVLMKRDDGTLDSIFLVVLDIPAAGKRFGVPVRVRQGGACAVDVGTTGVSGGPDPIGALMRRVVLRKRDGSVYVMAELTPVPAPELLEKHSATGWWLEGQPR